MTVLPFPPRDAGRVLEAAMTAAMAAAVDEAERLNLSGMPVRMPGEVDPILLVELVALEAAIPVLRGLTSDPAMVDIVAHGMVTEVITRLHKRGLA